MSFDNNPFDDATDYNYFRNGPTKHGTFVGTCKNCGIIWEFENYEVTPTVNGAGISGKERVSTRGDLTDAAG